MKEEMKTLTRGRKLGAGFSECSFRKENERNLKKRTKD